MLLNINSEVREDLKKIAPAEKQNMSKKLFGVLNEKQKQQLIKNEQQLIAFSYQTNFNRQQKKLSPRFLGQRRASNESAVSKSHSTADIYVAKKKLKADKKFKKVIKKGTVEVEVEIANPDKIKAAIKSPSEENSQLTEIIQSPGLINKDSPRSGESIGKMLTPVKKLRILQDSNPLLHSNKKTLNSNFNIAPAIKSPIIKMTSNESLMGPKSPQSDQSGGRIPQFLPGMSLLNQKSGSLDQFDTEGLSKEELDSMVKEYVTARTFQGLFDQQSIQNDIYKKLKPPHIQKILGFQPLTNDLKREINNASSSATKSCLEKCRFSLNIYHNGKRDQIVQHKRATSIQPPVRPQNQVDHPFKTTQKYTPLQGESTRMSSTNVNFGLKGIMKTKMKTSGQFNKVLQDDMSKNTMDDISTAERADSLNKTDTFKRQVEWDTWRVKNKMQIIDQANQKQNETTMGSLTPHNDLNESLENPKTPFTGQQQSPARLQNNTSTGFQVSSQKFWQSYENRKKQLDEYRNMSEQFYSTSQFLKYQQRLAEKQSRKNAENILTQIKSQNRKESQNLLSQSNMKPQEKQQCIGRNKFYGHQTVKNTVRKRIEEIQSYGLAQQRKNQQQYKQYSIQKNPSNLEGYTVTEKQTSSIPSEANTKQIQTKQSSKVVRF